MTGRIIGGIIFLLAAALAAMAVWNTALRSERNALQNERNALQREIAAHEEERAKTAAEMKRLTATAEALRKAGRKGEDKINEQIKASGDPCLNSRPDGAMLDLLRNGVPGHPE